MKQIISRVTAMKKKCKEEFDHFSDKYPVATCALAFLGAPVLLVGALTLTTTEVMLPFGINRPLSSRVGFMVNSSCSNLARTFPAARSFPTIRRFGSCVLPAV